MKLLSRFLLSLSVVAGSLIAGPINPGAVQNLNNINGVDYTATLGTVLNGTTHDSTRTDLTSAFDNNSSTFYSLGIGGTLEGVADPGLKFDLGVGVIEVTFGTVNSSFPESALVEFFEGATVKASVKLVNLGSQAGSCNSAVGLTCSSSATSSTTVWSITLPAAFDFTRIVVTDKTAVDFAGTYGTSRASDGFDIAELRLSTVSAATEEIPEPGTISMLGLGLGVLALAYRKRQRA